MAAGPLATMQRAAPQSTGPAALSATPETCCGAPAPIKAKVLRPAQVENWQSSSFDLLSGLQVRDVSDTIPGRVFEELFRTLPTTVFTKRRY